MLMLFYQPKAAMMIPNFEGLCLMLIASDQSPRLAHLARDHIKVLVLVEGDDRHYRAAEPRSGARFRPQTFDYRVPIR